MADFSISRSMSVMRRTMPFILMRMAIYFGITMAYILVTGAGAGVGWGVGSFGDGDFRATSTFWGGAIGFGGTAAVIYFLREYLLYMVKAAHLAVVVEYLDGKPLPEGRGQITHGREVVTERFAQANVLFGLDQLIKGVLRAVTGLVHGLANLLPIPGIDGLMRVVRAWLRVAVGFLDEVILAHLIRTRSENPWAGARDALVLYGQNAKPMLFNAALVALVSWLFAIVVFFLMLAPAGAIVYLMPGNWSAGAFLFALVMAWAIKAALIEPFAIACLLQAYTKHTDGQTPDPEWTARLEQASNKFKKLGEKAAGWVGGKADASTETQT